MKKSLVLFSSLSFMLAGCSTAIVKNPDTVAVHHHEMHDTRTEETPIHAAAAAPARNSASSAADQARAALEALRNNLRFQTASAKLAPSAAQSLSQAAAALKEANASVEVDGYADSTGTNALNDRLSNARAATVRSYLIKHGVASNHVAAMGHGESNPAQSNDTEAGRAANRRVEIKLN